MNKTVYYVNIIVVIIETIALAYVSENGIFAFIMFLSILIEIYLTLKELRKVKE